MRAPAALIILVFCILLSCKQTNFNKNLTHQYVADSSIEKGELLAARYCQSCHQLPAPSLLSADKWENGVLPQMGPRLGIFRYNFTNYPSAVRDVNVGRAFYPAKPQMSLEDWQHIIDYYTALAPDTLMASTKDEKVIPDNNLFQPVAPGTGFSYFNPVSGCIQARTATGNTSFFIADIYKKSLVWVKQKLVPLDSVLFTSPVLSMAFCSDTLITVNVGTLFPNDEQTGSIQQTRLLAGDHFSSPVILADSLRRPVHVDAADFNNDGLKDLLVCEFGNLKGALSWLENKGNNVYNRQVLRAVPGAITTVVKDYNKDGLPDFYVLFAQGDEQIICFTNKGNGVFEQRQVLRFPPVYGSSHFEMADMNKDGFDDIIYTCGDNADYSRELKPYHGVYIFLNDGKDNFRQSFFFHINGCYKAMVADFDDDGDKDIAAIAFFADYDKRPEEGFVYLKNEGDNHFTPYTVPGTANGRWLSMDVADVDSDGKPDIILGNFSATSFTKTAVNWQQQPAFLVLKNIMH